MVNSAFAQLYAPDKNNPSALIGKPLVNLGKGKTATIIGILNDQHQVGIARPSQPEVEFCVSQLSPGDGFYQPSTIAMDLVVRTDRPLDSVLPELRAVLRQASPEFANATFTTMDQVVEDSFGSQRLAAHLLEFFAASALLLSVAGALWIAGLGGHACAPARWAYESRWGRAVPIFYGWCCDRPAWMLLIGIAAGERSWRFLQRGSSQVTYTA